MATALVAPVGNRVRMISSDPVLRWFGATVALVNGLTAVFWMTTQPLPAFIGSQSTAVCWPFFEKCNAWRLLGPEQIGIAVAVLLCASLINAALFAERRFVPVAFWLLLVTSVVKLAAIALDYRLVLNQHYMATWAALLFFVLPNPRRGMVYLVILFYIAAGLLKLNPEWLSGAGLYGRRPFGMSASLIPWACGYVVFLELIVAAGLLARRGWIFWSAITQLVTFHLGSYWVVGYFYPVLMLLILSVVATDRIFPEGRDEAALGRTVQSTMREKYSAIGLIAVFILFQLPPRLIPGDERITGEGRMFALNMFDAPVSCSADVTVHNRGTADTVRTFVVPLLQPRIQCDPLVFFEAAKSRCSLNSKSKQFDDIRLRLRSGLVGSKHLQTTLDIDNFCSADLRYSLLTHNKWINFDAPPPES